MDNLGDDFSLTADHGIIEPRHESEIKLHFRAVKVVNVKKNIRIEVCLFWDTAVICTSHKNLPRKMKSRLAIINCEGNIFRQLQKSLSIISLLITMFNFITYSLKCCAYILSSDIRCRSNNGSSSK